MEKEDGVFPDKTPKHKPTQNMSLQQRDIRGKTTTKAENIKEALTGFPEGDGIPENKFFNILMFASTPDYDITPEIPNGAGNPDGFQDGDVLQITVADDVTTMSYTDPLTGYTYSFKEGDILCLCYDADEDVFFVKG